ncbi:holo-[acyl-carrier-protein] synthase [Lentibacillus populi]|uniref:Holo-[acyl-carrier-protein] synthase n=2 Tax=Bacillales TaxID=1385 RepID=A0A9W5U0G3_9BACI|nr:holo-[acyl-carrier-protein] synthase [Lentibacillus populi]
MDLIELARIKKSMERNTRLSERILTKNEHQLFFSLESVQRKTEFLAGRFAAKEAFAKACGRGIGKLSFQHIEVLPNGSGAPELTASGYEDVTIFISITHSKAYAAAQVVIEDK